VNSQDSQYQWGHPLLQLGMMAATPITSPMMKNQSTCRPARAGENRAQIHAHRIETTTNKPVLEINAAFEGIRPFSKSPGKSLESNGSVARTNITEST